MSKNRSESVSFYPLFTMRYLCKPQAIVEPLPHHGLRQVTLQCGCIVALCSVSHVGACQFHGGAS
jgi:hypothetical protein